MTPMPTKFCPTHDVLLLRKIDKPRTDGGLFLPENVGQKTMPTLLCEVIAVGPGGFNALAANTGYREPIDLKPGMTVMIPVSSYPQIRLDGVEYMIAKWGHVLGTIENS